ncbi:TonB-dependent siderophore receptor [Pleionea sp. CnH1-48]|uniref:TonB-dependent receptor plug domain-containing protein n=1 Tax=Pleionea sp. CnH1-48 TaxID=2954494 RepID=UPI002096F078|nr:TonB-dependent receptor [Pleionea sp. CnH1-48]MCO7223149.1 TonB-dependent receptor [Pleionea sp. CnH1-48]
MAVASSYGWADEGDLFDLDLRDLMQVTIVSASKKEEKLQDAPATVIVLTKEVFSSRGYQNLSEIFDDLPGMDVVRPYGDTYYKNYMRGFRNTIGSPFLLLIDGVQQNSLYFNITSTVTSYPLSNVERVEVIYGPTSSVYGANALMGVVNVITKKAQQNEGWLVDTQWSISDSAFKVFDGRASRKKGELETIISFRRSQGNYNDAVENNRFYWLQDSIYQNERLWGGALSSNAINPGVFSSPEDMVGIDARLIYKNTEFAASYFLLDTGYGTIYPADRIPANSTWPRIQYDAYVKHQFDINPKLNSKVLLRYRYDGIKNDSYDLEGFNRMNPSDTDYLDIGGITLAPQETARFLHFFYWQTRNWSWSLFQNFDYQNNEYLSAVFGYKVEVKDLQRAYDLPTSGPLSPELFVPYHADYWPQPPQSSVVPDNRITWVDRGVYGQVSYRFDDEQQFSFGLRCDDNSVYGSELTFRGAYIYNIDEWSFKLIYGEAYQEPVPRNLYGAWTGSGSSPDLKPEQAKTTEFSVTKTSEQSHHLVSLYHADMRDVIVGFTGGARNSGKRDVVGLDYHYQTDWDFDWAQATRFWTYTSLILEQKEDKFDLQQGDFLGAGIIGDLADVKMFAGIHSTLNDHWLLNLRGRYIGSRETVDTNPLGEIDAYFLLDAHIKRKNLITEGLDVSFSITNLLDRDYDHPGIRDANSGDPYAMPELLNDIGWYGPNEREWRGSLGWFNSRLPQPGRQLFVRLGYVF